MYFKTLREDFRLPHAGVKICPECKSFIVDLKDGGFIFNLAPFTISKKANGYVLQSKSELLRRRVKGLRKKFNIDDKSGYLSSKK